MKERNQRTRGGGAWRVRDDRPAARREGTEAAPEADANAGVAGAEDTGVVEAAPVTEQPAPGPVPEAERRAGLDRRVADEAVEVQRRQAERRAVEERLDRQARRQGAVTRATQGVDYVFFLLYGLLAVRFVLALLGARETAGFVQFITGLTQPFYGPFSNIVTRPEVNGGVMDFPLVIAVLAYALLHVAIRGLLRLVAGPRTVV